MDTSGFSTVGRYGTISLMKRNEPNTVVTAFGIDSEELTFGRDPNSSVRLYYPEVSLVHCKIVFEERKAFLVVFGPSGLLVDGCEVFPSQSPSGSSTMVPLSNNSEIEIHNKRFRFSYPPKDMRATLLSTPQRPNHRALRLSMIHSAQVFSPRPSNDPRENLRILKSPLKNAFKSPTKPSALSHSLLMQQEDEEEEEEEDSIVLVEGNCPRVVEEERDLVILEDVELSYHEVPQMQIHQPQPQPPQTPRRRSQSRNTLHRAVLIRSAHRAVMKAEREKEEHEEELEVLQQAVTDEEESDEEDEERLKRLEERLELSDSGDDMDVDEPYQREEDGEEYSGEEEEEYEQEYQEKLKDDGERTPFYQQKSTWRKSLEKLWPFRSLSPGKEEAPHEQGPVSESDSDDEDAHQPHPESQGTEPDPSDDEDAYNGTASDEGEEEEANEEPTPLPSHSAPQQTPVRRQLGSFMTPQLAGAGQRKLFLPLTQQQLRTLAPPQDKKPLADGPQRVPIEEPWRVQDIVVPMSGIQSSAANTRQDSPTRNSGRPTLTEEEKKAIQERRRSAVRQPDNFFAGGAPGMTPSKGKPAFFRPSMSPTKIRGRDNDENPFLGTSSPVRGSSTMAYAHQGSPEDDEVDTRSLLERMKETVEGMKRRRSVAPPGSLAATPRATPNADVFNDGNTPTPHSLFTSKSATEVEKDHAQEEETEVHENEDDDKENNVSRPYEEPFSLLRPGTREETFSRRQSIVVLEKVGASQDKEPETEPMNEDMKDDTVPMVVVEPSPEEDDTNTMEEEAPPTHGKARNLRARAKVTQALDVPDEKEASTSRRTTPCLRSRSPQPASMQVEEAGVVEESKQPEEGTSRLRASTRRKGRSQSRTPQPQQEEIPAVVAEETVPEDEPQVTEEEDIMPAPVKAPARRTRKATAEPEEPPAPAPEKRGKKTVAESEEATSAPARRGRKATVEPPDAPKEEKLPVKRGRKPAVKDEPTPAEVTPIAASSRRGRKPAPTPATEPAKPTQLPVPKNAVPRTAPVRKTRATKSKAAVEAEAMSVDEEDELDTLGKVEEEVIVPTAKARGKKKATVKEEEPEDDDSSLPVTRAGRSKSATGTRSAATTKVPVTATKSRLPRKAPATVPAATSSTEVDKENAPKRSTSGKSSPAESEGTAPVKVRISRSTKATKAASTTKVKEETEGAEGDSEPRGRVMRSTRKVKVT